MKLRKLTPLIILIFVATLFIPLSGASARPTFPDMIPLFDGFQPEGIAVGYGHTFYTGSLNGGAIFRGDLRSGEVEKIAAPDFDQKMAVGMAFDQRSGMLFVAGGAFGTAYVYDGKTGEQVASYQLTTSQAVFINDVVVTRQAAYFTDSFQKQIYRLPLGPAGALPDQAEVTTIALGDGFGFMPGEFNANGIESSQDDSLLVIINTFEGKLYRVDPVTGESAAIDLGDGTLPTGDGLVLRGHTLYVVQNFRDQIAVVELDPGFASGAVTSHLTSDNFRIPTTAALFGDALYAVNARFDAVPPGQPDLEDTFEAVRVPIH